MARTRIVGYDVLRGLAVISMIGFHLCYDIAYIRQLPLPWFRPPFQDVWRASISWTFLVLAGIMCSYSRNNLRRAGLYLGVALAIFVSTTVVAVDTPISFGIIYVMGFSTLVAWLLCRFHVMPRSPRACAVVACCLFVAFVLCLGVPQGTLGLKPFGGPFVTVPTLPYASGMLSWLGFPGPTFASGDYYPPLPFTLLYLAGAVVGVALRQRGCPDWFARLSCPPLAFVGRHALPIYLLHQPLLLVIVGVL